MCLWATTLAAVVDFDGTAEGEPPPLPTQVDWRTKGVLRPVVNQGDMGCSPNVVATEAVESYHAIHTGQLVSLSSAEVTSCCSRNCSLLGVDIFQCIASV